MIHFIEIIFCVVLFSITSYSQKYSKRIFKKIAFAESFIDSANSSFREKEYKRAIYHYKKAGHIYGKLELWIEKVECDVNIGICFLQYYEVDSSAYYIVRNLPIVEMIFGESIQEIRVKEDVYYLLANNCSLQFNYNDAILYYNKALEINSFCHQIDSLRNNRAPIYHNYLGIIYEEKGNYDDALDCYMKSIAAIDTIMEPKLVYQLITNHINIGSIYLKKFDLDRALLYFVKANNISDDNHDFPSLKVTILNSIGLVHFEKNDFETALNYFNNSLILAQRDSNLLISAALFNNIGDVHRSTNDHNEAISHYEKSLAIYSTIKGKESLESAFIYNNIANAYRDLQKYNISLDFYLKSLSIRKREYGDTHFRISQNYQNIGLVYFEQKEYNQALINYQKALTSNIFNYNDTNIFSIPGINLSIISYIDFLETIIFKADAFYSYYLCNLDSIKYLENSIQNYDFALDIADKIRNNYSTSGSKLNLYRILYKIFPKAIYAVRDYNLYKNDDPIDNIFKYIERSKGLVLYTSLLDSKAKVIAGIPDSLIAKEINIKEEISYYNTQLLQITEKKEFSQLKHYENQYYSLNQSYDSLIKYYEDNYAKYYQLKYDAKISTIEEIKHSLGKTEALVEYFITDSNLYIITLTNEKSKLFTIQIDAHFDSIASNYNKYIKLAEFKHFLSASSYLYNKIINPVLAVIEDKDKIIIIPDNYLYFIPFETLLSQNNVDEIIDFSKYNYLIKDFEIVYHYSSTLWKYCKENSNSAANEFVNEFIGFAPVFNKETGYRISSQIDTKEVFISTEKESPKEDQNRHKFRELPYSKEEVFQIFKMFINNGKKSEAFFLSEASEYNFRSNIKKAKYVHVATHGIINDKNPNLSGLIFYNTLDSTIFNQNKYYSHRYLAKNPHLSNDDGILFTDEIYNLSIEAELVTLSACNTGVGKLIHGEGLMAMTRGFIYCGVKNVIFSVWKISDKHTKELMILFYKGLLNDNNYSKSLQNAKIEMIKNPVTSFPLFWGGFLLLGS